MSDEAFKQVLEETQGLIDDLTTNSGIVVMHENIQDDVEGEVEPEEGEEKKTVDVESVTDKPSQSSKIAIFLRF